MQIIPETTVGQLVTERPARSRLLERLGIDYCCGGRISLADACARRGLELEAVVEQLREYDAATDDQRDEGADPASMTMVELADHIEATHHAWLREELPRLAGLLAKVADAHGGRDPRLVQLRDHFEQFAYELFAHMQKEERVLFPALRQLGQGVRSEQHRQLDGPIDAMTREHDEAGSALQAMRRLTDDFAVPAGACNTHRAVLDALARLERDMHRHIHKENNILFPQARRAAGLAEGA